MAYLTEYPVIDLQKTGKNIHRLREERKLSVRDLQIYFRFEAPAAIYRWQRGDNLPTLDNMVALSKLFDVAIEDILVLEPSDKTDENKLIPPKTKRSKKIPPLLFSWQPKTPSPEHPQKESWEFAVSQLSLLFVFDRQLKQDMRKNKLETIRNNPYTEPESAAIGDR